MTSVTGLVLAAGAGRRMGRPKALMTDPDGTSWLARAVAICTESGCATTVVVLGASGPESALDLPGTRWLHCPDWAAGLGASLTCGLTDLLATHADAALIHLVDLPDVTAQVARRVLTGPVTGQTLRRASYDGTPGHPVLIGRDHWSALIAEVAGDRGAGAYLQRHRAALVDCADLATGRDVDHPH